MQDFAGARIIYKICPQGLWRQAERQGRFEGSADDLRDGFVHFSTASQLPETARRHFAGQDSLLLISVDANALGDALRWEPSRGGELFPHLHGDLDLRAVIEVRPMPRRADGSHELPEVVA